MAADRQSSSLKDMERDHWQKHASVYDDLAGPMTKAPAARLLDAVGARPAMHLLDVCCGPGYGAGQAAERGLTAIGVDISPTMVAEARRRFPSAEFRVGDAEQLDFPEASFDAVICPFGLLHLPEPDKALAEAFRVLKPGGRYAFTVWCTPDKAEFLGIAMRATSAHADMNVPLPSAPPLFQFADTALAILALERAGFQAANSEDIPVVFRGKTPDDVWLWFEHITVRAMAIFRLQEPAVQQRINQAVIDEARRYMGNDGVSIPCTAVMYSAKKPA
jgi:ubiquinone/menaquinone biosynthesis C-methylase UbiE